MLKYFFICCVTAIMSFSAISSAYAKRAYAEAKYQKKWCMDQKGRAEVVMRNRTRCDCVTDDYAVEFDFADKWAEAIGQSLHYSTKTGKKAGIVLIMENQEKDRKYLARLEDTIKGKKLPIKVWTVNKSFLSGKKAEDTGFCFVGAVMETGETEKEVSFLYFLIAGIISAWAGIYVFRHQPYYCSPA